MATALTLIEKNMLIPQLFKQSAKKFDGLRTQIRYRKSPSDHVQDGCFRKPLAEAFNIY